MSDSSSDGVSEMLMDYDSQCKEALATELNYCGYGVYRTGYPGARSTRKLEDAGITHVLSLGKENFIPKEKKLPTVKYYEKHIRDANTNDDKRDDEGGWAGFWKDEKVLAFIQDGMPNAEHPNTRLLVHCTHGLFRTGHVLRGIMVKFKDHKPSQAYRRVDYITILICDFPKAVEVLLNLSQDPQKRETKKDLEKFLEWPDANDRVDHIEGYWLVKKDDKLLKVDFEGCPEDPYEKDEKVQVAIKRRLDMLAKMP